jgi:hypothetical protein
MNDRVVVGVPAGQSETAKPIGSIRLSVAGRPSVEHAEKSGTLLQPESYYNHYHLKAGTSEIKTRMVLFEYIYIYKH